MLRTNASLRFNAYEGVDAGIILRFVCADPGAGADSDYEVLITDTDLATIGTPAQFRDLVVAKLRRKYRAIAALDGFVGATVTI